MAVKKWKDDYTSEILKSVEKGDYKNAALNEVERNEKIDYLNETGTNTGNWEKTYDYHGWLDNNDYSTKGQYQMATNAPTWEVEETLNNRYNKALGTKGMEQYLNDDVTKQMIDYIAKNKGGYNDILNSRPTYESKNDAKIDEMYDKIMNREAFSYNAESDPLYQQYAEMYRREGDRAMRDTLAEVAMGAGGMNSYAITAAQQANDYYNQKIADKIPELQQLAYSMYLDEGNRMRDDLGLLIDMENNEYNRYLNDLGQWNNDLNFAYGREQDEYSKGIDERNWNYQLDRDAVNDARRQTEWDYGVGQDAIDNKYRQDTLDLQKGQAAADNKYRQDALDYQKDRDAIDDERYDEQSLMNMIDFYLQNGGSPSNEILEKFEMTRYQYDTMLNFRRDQLYNQLYN